MPSRQETVPYSTISTEKFRKRGNKNGAIRAFYQLEEDGLGKVVEVAGSKGNVCVSVTKLHVIFSIFC